MDPHGVLTGALERQGPSTFPRPDCAGGCGSSMGTNPGRTHRFCAPPARRCCQLQKALAQSTSACLSADTGKAVVPFVTLTVPVFAVPQPHSRLTALRRSGIRAFVHHLHLFPKADRLLRLARSCARHARGDQGRWPHFPVHRPAQGRGAHGQLLGAILTCRASCTNGHGLSSVAFARRST